MSFSYSIDRRPNAVIASLSGSLDLNTADRVNEAIDAIVRNQSPLTVLDLSRCTYLNSLGIGAFVRLHQGVKPQGGRVRLAACNGFIKSVLSASKLAGVLPQFETIEDALRD